MTRRLAPLLVLPLLLGISACRKEADPVRATIEALEASAEDRDADAAGALLAAAYSDREHPDRAAALLTIRRYFTAYESIAASFSDLVVDRKPELARATFTATFNGSPRRLGALAEMLPRSAKVRFEMNLAPEGDGWKVVWASWTLVSEGTGP